MNELESKLSAALAGHISPPARIGRVFPCRMGADAGFAVEVGASIFFVRERFGKLEKAAAWEAAEVETAEIKPGFMGLELRAKHHGGDIRLSRLSEQDAAALAGLLGCASAAPRAQAGHLDHIEQDGSQALSALEKARQNEPADESRDIPEPLRSSGPSASRIPPWTQTPMPIASGANGTTPAGEPDSERSDRDEERSGHRAGSEDPVAAPADSTSAQAAQEKKPEANPSAPSLGLGFRGVVIRALIAGGLSGFFLYSMIEGVEHKYGLNWDDWLDLPKFWRGPLLWVVMAVIGPLALPHLGRLVRMIPWGLAAAIGVALIKRKPYEMEFYGAEYLAWILIASGYLRTRKVEVWFILGPIAAALILPASTFIPKAIFEHMSDIETGITLGVFASVFWFVLFAAEIDKPQKA